MIAKRFRALSTWEVLVLVPFDIDSPLSNKKIVFFGGGLMVLKMINFSRHQQKNDDSVKEALAYCQSFLDGPY